jgi:hypothetical protein
MLVFSAVLHVGHFLPMTKRDIQLMQEKIGVVPDGVWGPVSKAACKQHLRRLMPLPNPWPFQDENSLNEFYGRAGDENKLVNLSVDGLGVAYNNRPVRTIRCHHRVAVSLYEVRADLSVSFPHILAQFAGCYNNRAVRGGTKPSLHARGAAIDFAPAYNGNTTRWPQDAMMPLEVMEFFSYRGWLSAGAFWSRDAMHFQATR